MTIIDTHTHYNLEPLFSGQPSHFDIKRMAPLKNLGWQDHWQQAQQHGIIKSVVVGTQFETCHLALEIHQQESHLHPAIGIHPHHADTLENESAVKKLRDLAQQPEVVAIGETGLDYYSLPLDKRKALIKQQKQAFITQIKLANQLNLPLIVHVRDREAPEKEQGGNAYWDTLNHLREYHQSDKPFILHCVSGPLSYTKQALDRGGVIGVAANVGYKKADDIKKIVKYTPPDRLLIETDAPYLPPQEHRGKICQPWMIRKTAEYLTREMQIDLDQLVINAQNLFNI